MKMNSLSSIVVSLLCGLAFLLPAHAVVPPPDGGYPNFTTAEGQKALFNLTSGAANTALGWFSLSGVTTGAFNTGVGAGTLVLNTGDENTAIGTGALLLNTANGNTAVGSRALLNNTTGGTVNNVSGFDVGPNVAVGQQALERNTVGSANTAVGYQALHSFITGPAGSEQLGFSTAVGFQALASANGTGGNNAFGYQALMNNIVGFNNTAIGAQAMFFNTIGANNTASGTGALEAITVGNNNTGVGFGALDGPTTGDYNIGLGAFAGTELSGNDSNNIEIGNAGNTGGESDSIRIGTTQVRTFIAGISAEDALDGVTVFVTADGKLGTNSSSCRFKRDIRPMAEASEAILALKPVSFHYKSDAKYTPYFGLVAEDVEKVNPALIVRDKEGKPNNVRYDQVNAMLLNEFLKEHRKVEALRGSLAEQQKNFEATIARQQKQIEALAAGLQKVSAQLATARPSLADLK